MGKNNFAEIPFRYPLIEGAARAGLCRGGVTKGSVELYLIFIRVEEAEDIFNAYLSSGAYLKEGGGCVPVRAVFCGCKVPLEVQRYARFYAEAKREDYLPLPAPYVEICEKEEKEALALAASAPKFSLVFCRKSEREKLLSAAGGARVIAAEEGASGIIERAAALRNAAYAGDEKDAREAFSKLSEEKRAANLFSCASIRGKLLSCGFDCAESGEEAEEEFLRVYYAGDEPRLKEGRIVYKNEDFSRNSVRSALARAEHERWNSYMICRGFVPASRARIEKEGAVKDEERREHANITTFEGLKEFAAIAARLKGVSEEETDVIRYDYMLMDEAPALVFACGAKIVKLEKTRK